MTGTISVTPEQEQSSSAPQRPARPKVPARRLPVTGLLALAWLVIVAVAGVFAPVLAPYEETEQDLWATLQGPSLAHPLGTDTIGRDVLSRLMYGAPETLIGVLLAVSLFVAFGVVSGLLSGYFAGWTDRVLSGIVHLVISTPVVIILFVILSVYRGNTLIAMAVFGCLSSPVMALVVRSATLSIRRELFVDAAKVSGLPDLHIVASHVLPRVGGLIIVQAAVFGANAVVIESALSFLGFGKQPPEATWGNMVSEAADTISLNSWFLYPTGAVIALTALSLGLLGDRLRDRSAQAWTASHLTSGAGLARQREAPPANEVRSEALLSVRDFSVAYRVGAGSLEVVKSVSFDVERGRTVGLVGESGSGKTTIALAVLGIVGATIDVTDGSVLYDGTELLELDAEALRRYRGKQIAYVAQEPMVALDPNHRIGALLTEAVRTNDPGPSSRARERALELLRDVEIPHPEEVLRMYPHQLSGGMAQRVSIAIALAGSPELLVADEPTTALDVTVQAGILGLLRRLQQENDMALLLITHDWGVVADICDEVVVLHRGGVVEDGSVETLFENPAHPYTRALLAADPHGAAPGQFLPVPDPGEIDNPVGSDDARDTSDEPIPEQEAAQP